MPTKLSMFRQKKNFDRKSENNRKQGPILRHLLIVLVLVLVTCTYKLQVQVQFTSGEE